MCSRIILSTPDPTTPFPENYLLDISDKNEPSISNILVPQARAQSTASSSSSSMSGSAYTPPASTTLTPSTSQINNSRQQQYTKRSKPMSVMQGVKKAKLVVCQDKKTSASFRLREKRLKVLLLAMQIRREIGSPFEIHELPRDLHDLLFNVQTEL